MNETNADSSESGPKAGKNQPTQLADETELDRFRKETNVALVEFYTNGCGICQSMAPVLGNVARALEVSVGLVNPRNDPPLVERFNVQSVPLLVLFVDGQPVARRADGFVSGDELTAWIRENTPRHTVVREYFR